MEFLDEFIAVFCSSVQPVSKRLIFDSKDASDSFAKGLFLLLLIEQFLSKTIISNFLA